MRHKVPGPPLSTRGRYVDLVARVIRKAARKQQPSDIRYRHLLNEIEPDYSRLLTPRHWIQSTGMNECGLWWRIRFTY